MRALVPRSSIGTGLAFWLTLAALSCGGADGAAGGGGSRAEGAIELLAPGTGWKTLGSVTGRAVPDHMWGAARSEYEFTGQAGNLRRTAGGYELLAYGVKSTQQEEQHTLLSIAFDADFGAAQATPYFTAVRSGRPREVHFATKGIWIWAKYGDVRHAIVTEPADGPPWATAQRLAIPEAPYTTGTIDANDVPWFETGGNAFTYVDAAVDATKPSPFKQYLCDLCLNWRPNVEGAPYASSPMFVDGAIYWAAFSQKPLGAERFVILTPQPSPNTATSTPWQFLSEPLLATNEVALDFDEYTRFESHVMGGRGYLTWMSAQKVSQLVFDPKAKTVTERYRDLPTDGFDPATIKLSRSDSKGDLFVLVEGADGARSVKKLGPSGVVSVGGPLRFSTSSTGDGTPFSRSVDALYVVDDRPLLVLSANGEQKVEPQISVIAPE